MGNNRGPMTDNLAAISIVVVAVLVLSGVLILGIPIWDHWYEVIFKYWGWS